MKFIILLSTLFLFCSAMHAQNPEYEIILLQPEEKNIDLDVLNINGQGWIVGSTFEDYCSRALS